MKLTVSPESKHLVHLQQNWYVQGALDEKLVTKCCHKCLWIVALITGSDWLMLIKVFGSILWEPVTIKVSSIVSGSVHGHDLIC